MTTIFHKFVSAIPDDPVAAAAGEVLTQSHWNAAHADANGNPIVVRTILTADTTYHVATIGSDLTGDGSIGNPWATLQYAVDWIGRFVDASGRWVVSIQLADGTYSGAEIGPQPLIYVLNILGNAANNTKVVLLDTGSGANGCCIQVTGSVPILILQNLTYHVTQFVGQNSGITIVGDGSIISVVNPYFKCTTVGVTGYSCIYIVASNSFVSLSRNLINELRGTGPSEFPGFFVEGAWTSCFNLFGAFSCFQELGHIITFTLVGTPSFAEAFYDFTGAAGYMFFNSWTVVGSATGSSYHFGGDPSGSQLAAGSFPGSLSTSTSAKGCFVDGFEFFDLNSLPTPTSAQIFQNAFGLLKDANQPTGLGLRFWANDAGTIVPVTRQVLISNVSFSIAITGSDSNPGTPGSPWATPQHAMDYISANIDIAGFTITVNIGHGSFAGVFGTSTLGDGQILWQGSGPTGPSVTTFTTSEDGFSCYEVSATLTTIMTFDGIAFKPGNSGVGLGLYNPSITNIGGGSALGINFIVPAGGGANFIQTVDTAVQCNTFNNITVDGSSGGSNNIIHLVSALGEVFDNASWTMTGTPKFGNPSAIQCFNGGVISSQGGSYTGAATGKRFTCSTGGIITANTPGTLGPNFYPGNSPGTTDAVSAYDGIPGTNYDYQQPITGFTITMNNADTDLIIDPAGTLAAGTVKMAASPIDGQKVTIRTSQIITSLTINGNGATVAGYATGTLGLGGVLNAIYQSANTTWYF